MTLIEIKEMIERGRLSCLGELYSDPEAQRGRFCSLVDGFRELYGDGEAMLLSVPGRTEICGNHTDHNNGRVIAGAIDRDVISLVRTNDNGVVRLKSLGYPESLVRLSDIHDPNNFEKFSSPSLIAGVMKGFLERGYNVGGFDAFVTSDVLKGSGISSSAAFEVMIGNIINHLYNGGRVANTELAKIAKYAENVYFGKPSGLMDQMACAVGGFVYIDFSDKDEPEVLPIDFSLKQFGYSLAIVNTGGNHADLNDDYASVPSEMRAVAEAFGKSFLSEVDEHSFIKAIPSLRESVGDRAILRAMHFFNENRRVVKMREALTEKRLGDFLGIVNESGNSSFKYLQNVYTNINVREQGLSLALSVGEAVLGDGSAMRVHGGGFAGTVQAFMPDSEVDSFRSAMDAVFGEGATMLLNIRPLGAARLL